ncbi:pirin family protein [bacterium]|nr:pirin family protein [bacterium]
MITIRRSKDRGVAEFGWLHSNHSFSFGSYNDPDHMNYRAMRVLNDDWIEPSGGFPMHPHRDMEILTYMLEGALAHEDSMGHKSTIRHGDIQKMTAGTGIVHSEFNASDTEKAHLLQIWFEPNVRGLKPSYEERRLPLDARTDKLALIASPDESDSAVTIRQDVRVYASILTDGAKVRYETTPDRHIWIQMAKGGATVNGEALNEGDAAAVEDTSEIVIRATSPAEIVLFDLV